MSKNTTSWNVPRLEVLKCLLVFFFSKKPCYYFSLITIKWRSKSQNAETSTFLQFIKPVKSFIFFIFWTKFVDLAHSEPCHQRIFYCVFTFSQGLHNFEKEEDRPALIGWLDASQLASTCHLFLRKVRGKATRFVVCLVELIQTGLWIINIEVNK